MDSLLIFQWAGWNNQTRKGSFLCEFSHWCRVFELPFQETLVDQPLNPTLSYLFYWFSILIMVCRSFGPNWNISSVRWITITFCTDIHGPQRQTLNDFCDPTNFSLAPPVGLSFLRILWQNTYSTDWQKMWYKHNTVPKRWIGRFWPHYHYQGTFPLALVISKCLHANNWN